MIAGGLFSINKTTFEVYGKYDSHMDIWVRKRNQRARDKHLV